MTAMTACAARWRPFPRRQAAVADAAMLPDMDTPEQYATLQRMAACHDALTRDEAEGLLLQAGVPEQGLRHALAVGRVAEALCAALAEARGEEAPVETALALASGLTHDICKGMHGHEAAGGRLLARLGLARMAAIVAAHRDQSVPAEKEAGRARAGLSGGQILPGRHLGAGGPAFCPETGVNSATIRERGPVSKGGATGPWPWNGDWPPSWAVTPRGWRGKPLAAADIDTRAHMLDARRAPLDAAVPPDGGGLAWQGSGCCGTVLCRPIRNGVSWARVTRPDRCGTGSRYGGLPGPCWRIAARKADCRRL